MRNYNDLFRETLIRVFGENLVDGHYAYNKLYKDAEMCDVFFDGVSIYDMDVSEIMGGDHNSMLVYYYLSYLENGGWKRRLSNYVVYHKGSIRDRLDGVWEKVRLIRRTEILNNITNE